MDSIIIGERIALLRKKNGYTQQQLADILSLSSKTISRWETGEGFPEISMVPQLAKTLGVSLDQLLEDTNNEYWEKQYKNTLLDDRYMNKATYTTVFITLCCVLVYQIGLLFLGFVETFIYSSELYQIGIITAIVKILQIILAIVCFIMAYKIAIKHKEHTIDSCFYLPLISLSFCISSEIFKKIFFYASFQYFAKSIAEIECNANYDVFTLGTCIIELFAIMAITITIFFCVKNKKITLGCCLIGFISIIVCIVIAKQSTENAFFFDMMLLKAYESVMIILVSLVIRLLMRKDLY